MSFWSQVLRGLELRDWRRHSEVSGSGPLPMNAIDFGGVRSTAWRAASSRRVRST